MLVNSTYGLYPTQPAVIVDVKGFIHVQLELLTIHIIARSFYKKMIQIRYIKNRNTYRQHLKYESKMIKGNVYLTIWIR